MRLEDWQQFQKIDLEIHERLTIITGANGSGKTTLLGVLARHFSWDLPTLAIPTSNKKTGLFKWVTSLLGKNAEVTQGRPVGDIIYRSGTTSALIDPQVTASAAYSLAIQNQQQVEGLFIPSQRSVYRYQPLASIPTNFDTLSRLNGFQRFAQLNRERYMGGGGGNAANYQIKEILVGWNTFGYGNQNMKAVPILAEYFQGFESILKTILPSSLGFRKLQIANFEVLLVCDTGTFLLDASSGGVTALIDIAWQIFMFSEDKSKSFTVVIDEVENHLHPSMQRELLSSLITAFPNVTFVVSTHSPLVVNSVRDSNVYALRYDANKVLSERLDLVNKAKTATEILDEVLGVSFTMPIWAEKELQVIIARLAHRDLTAEDFAQIRTELKVIGLEDLMPEAVERIIEKYDDTDH